MGKKSLILLLLLLAGGLRMSAGNLFVPSMELISRGYLENSLFKIETRGNIDFVIDGGYKFGGRVVLGLNSDNLIYSDEDVSDHSATLSELASYLASQTYMTFKTANVIIRDIFNFPIDITYFTGEFDTFSTGSDFPILFGTRPIASRYGGYTYFAEGIQYEGIHRVTGSGIKIATSSLTDWYAGAFYIYQDSYLTREIGLGRYSADFRSILNFENFKIDAFIGASFPVGSAGIYRGGVLMYFKAGDTGEFLTQIGIPRWDPITEIFTMDLFYFLFEPRVHLGNFTIIPTLFWHPKHYLQRETGETGSVDINLNFLIGDPMVSTFTGGVETSIGFYTEMANQFRTVISPHVSVMTAGVIWNIKVNLQVVPFDMTDLIEVFLGINAEF
jgi:hypothetical protein